MIAKFEVVVVGPEKLIKDFNKDLVELLFEYNFVTHSVSASSTDHDELLVEILKKVNREVTESITTNDIKQI